MSLINKIISERNIFDFSLCALLRRGYMLLNSSGGLKIDGSAFPPFALLRLLRTTAVWHDA